MTNQEIETESEMNRAYNLLDPEQWADVIHLLGQLLQTQGKEEESRGIAEDAAAGVGYKLAVDEARWR